MRVEVIEPKLFSGVIADEFVALIAEAIEDHGNCTIALSGGSTPGQVYRALSVPPRVNEIQWSRVKLFWGDERWVPEDDTRSNYRLVQETLLAHLRSDIPKVYKVDTSLSSPDAGARAYHDLISKEVRLVNGVPCFDLMILGVGEDGHTASLFPQTPLLTETKVWAASADHPSDGTVRITMTPPVITGAKNITYFVKGSQKADIVAEMIQGDASIEKYPARIFTKASDRVVWFLDSEAASKLNSVG